MVKSTGIPSLEITQRQTDVYGVNDGHHIIVFMKNNGKISAYIAFRLEESQGFHNLERMHNINAQQGSITALIAFIHKKYSTKFRIDKTERLTKEGLNWICKLLDEGRGFTITDLNNNTITSNDLIVSWNHARQTNKHTEFGLLIHKINTPANLSETWPGILQPAYIYLSSHRVFQLELLL